MWWTDFYQETLMIRSWCNKIITNCKDNLYRRIKIDFKTVNRQKENKMRIVPEKVKMRLKYVVFCLF